MNTPARPGRPCAASEETRRLLRLREEDLISAGESGRLSAHLDACAPCREEALRADPTLLFRSLSVSGGRSRSGGAGLPDAGAAEGKRLAAQFRATLELDRARRRVSPGTLGGAWGIGRFLPGRDRWGVRTGRRGAAVTAVTAATAATAVTVAKAAAVAGIALVVASILRTAIPASPGGGDPVATGWSVDPAVPSPSASRVLSSAFPRSPARGEGPGDVPPIEVVASPQAKVYQFAPASRHEPTVVFVVDRDADL